MRKILARTNDSNPSWLLVCFFSLACSGAASTPSETESTGGSNSNPMGGTVNSAAGGSTTRGGTTATATGGTVTGNGGVAMSGTGGATAISTGGATTTSAGGAIATGGATTTASTGGATTNVGGASNGGTATGGAGKGGTATGGALATGGSGKGGTSSGGTATGGTTATGGAKATGGTMATGGSTATGGTFTLDCGPLGWAVEAHGPPSNRVNYAILGDGYTSADLVAGGTFEQHVNKAMTKRFSVPIGEVYSRYRKFVNICGIKIVSTGAICGSSALGCCGDDSSRLATCNNTSVNSAFNTNVPASFSLDWRAVVLNGSSWWNTGSATMLWSGGHADAAGAALHEGGHGFHQLADEYCASGSGTSCGPDTNWAGTTGTEYAEVNSTGNPTTTSGKWDLWKGYTQTGATGLQSTFQGSRYVDSGQYRPSANSMMNSLFGTNPNTSFNPVSREQMIFNIWRVVVPIDSTTPAAGAVTNPSTLTVKVIDPAVIDVDWSVDGSVVAVKGGETFDVTAQNLSSGSHTVSAKVYDNAGDDLVRYKTSTCPASVTGGYCSRSAWNRSQQTVTWTVTIP